MHLEDPMICTIDPEAKSATHTRAHVNPPRAFPAHVCASSVEVEHAATLLAVPLLRQPTLLRNLRNGSADQVLGILADHVPAIPRHLPGTRAEASTPICAEVLLCLYAPHGLA